MTPSTQAPLPSRGRPDLPRIVSRWLAPFARVEPDEVVGVLLMTATVFLLLTTYYLLKIAREPLILLGHGGGAEVKSYAAAGQAVLLLGVVKAFAALSQRVGRMRLITIVTLFFATNLIAFVILGRLGVALGVPFYLWVGVFNVTIIGQFWSLANDLVTPAQGKRLFAIVGIGSSLGAVFGARIAGALFRAVGVWGLMFAAAALLLVSLGLTALANRHFEKSAATTPPAPLAPAGAFSLIAQDRYLQLIGLLVILLNLVNTTGEYVLDRTLLASLAGQPAAQASQGIALFKASFFQWVNVISVLLQLFVVSRVMRDLGMRVALLVLPAVALGGYGLIAFLPLLSIAFATKVAENSLDYSLQNTARQTLFLPTSREAKYQAKVALDTFLVRGGDVLSAGVIWLGMRLHADVRSFALLNVGFAAVWIVVAARLGAHHAGLTTAKRDVKLAGVPCAV